MVRFRPSLRVRTAVTEQQWRDAAHPQWVADKRACTSHGASRSRPSSACPASAPAQDAGRDACLHQARAAASRPAGLRVRPPRQQATRCVSRRSCRTSRTICRDRGAAGQRHGASSCSMLEHVVQSYQVCPAKTSWSRGHERARPRHNAVDHECCDCRAIIDFGNHGHDARPGSPGAHRGGHRADGAGRVVDRFQSLMQTRARGYSPFITELHRHHQCHAAQRRLPAAEVMRDAARFVGAALAWWPTTHRSTASSGRPMALARLKPPQLFACTVLLSRASARRRAQPQPGQSGAATCLPSTGRARRALADRRDGGGPAGPACSRICCER